MRTRGAPMASRMKLAAHTMPSFEPVSLRCISLGLAVLALSLALRWAAATLGPDPWRAQPILQTAYAERGALLLALDVVSMALLTAGVLGTRHAVAVPVCAFWSTAGALLECTQLPAVVDRTLTALTDLPADSLLANTISLYLLNGEFSIAELVAALMGGAVAYLCIERCARSTRRST